MAKYVVLIIALHLPLSVVSQSARQIIRRFDEKTNIKKILDTSPSIIMELKESINLYGLVLTDCTIYNFYRNDDEFRQIKVCSETDMENYIHKNGLGFMLRNNDWEWADGDTEKAIKQNKKYKYIYDGFDVFDPDFNWKVQKTDESVHILMGKKDNVTLYLHFDKSTGYLVKSEEKYTFDKVDDVTINTIYNDHKTFNDVILPATILREISQSDNEIWLKIDIERVYFDARLPDALFLPEVNDPLGRVIPQRDLDALLSRVTNGQFATSTGKILPERSIQSSTISGSRSQTTSATTSTRPAQTTTSQPSGATTTASTSTSRPAAEFRMGGYFSLGAGFSIVSSKVEFEPFIGYNIEMYHDAAFHIKGGLSLYRSRGYKPVGPFVNAGLSFFRSGQMNLYFNGSYYNYAWGMSSMIIIESSGSIMNAGFDLSLGNVFPVAGIFSIAPYFAVNPGFLLLSTDGEGFTSYTDPYFNQYRSNTTVKSRSFYIMPEMGVIFNIGSFFVKPSLLFLSPAMNLEISSVDFERTGEGNQEYEHPVKFSSMPFMVSLGFRF